MPSGICRLSLLLHHLHPLPPLAPLRGSLRSPVAGAPDHAPPRHFHVLEHYPDEHLPRHLHHHLLPNRPHHADPGHRFAELPVLPQIPPTQGGHCLGPHVPRCGHHLLLRTQAAGGFENHFHQLLRRGAGHGQCRGFGSLYHLGCSVSEKIRDQRLSAPLQPGSTERGDFTLRDSVDGQVPRDRGGPYQQMGVDSSGSSFRLAQE